jgi:hypothetical protein
MSRAARVRIPTVVICGALPLRALSAPGKLNRGGIAFLNVAVVLVMSRIFLSHSGANNAEAIAVREQGWNARLGYVGLRRSDLQHQQLKTNRRNAWQTTSM